MRTAWERFDLARRKAELYPDTVEYATALIDARRDWRLAYYRLLTDLASPLAAPFDETAAAENGVEVPPEMAEELLALLREAGK
ncbi:hypothetical protein SDC9_173002 [bioreactor metagenome]|uniref:Uncharacterized protein n=1 Tax=bioreactor metagenome TaxID=1076179 RepID=A0A645GHG2_9ZZZZ